MQQDEQLLVCEECEKTVLSDHRYCHNCGNYLGQESTTINIFNNLYLRQIFFFYFVYLFVCLFVKHNSWFRTYDQLFWVELILAAITIRFAWTSRAEIKPI